MRASDPSVPEPIASYGEIDGAMTRSGGPGSVLCLKLSMWPWRGRPVPPFDASAHPDASDAVAVAVDTGQAGTAALVQRVGMTVRLARIRAEAVRDPDGEVREAFACDATDVCR